MLGVANYYLAFYFRKLNENERIWSLGVRVPLGSANATCQTDYLSANVFQWMWETFWKLEMFIVVRQIFTRQSFVSVDLFLLELFISSLRFISIVVVHQTSAQTLQQLCDDTSDTGLIENNLVASKLVAILFWSDSIDSNESVRVDVNGTQILSNCWLVQSQLIH